jgi:hypothetical protein
MWEAARLVMKRRVGWPVVDAQQRPGHGRAGLDAGGRGGGCGLDPAAPACAGLGRPTLALAFLGLAVRKAVLLGALRALHL